MNKLFSKLPVLGTVLAASSLILPSISLAQECYDNPNLITSSSKEFIAHNDGTVTHLQTRIMWQQCLAGMSAGAGGACSEGELELLNWQQALQYVEDLNDAGGFAGYTDWRLPNAKELTSVIEYGCSKPAMNLQIFPYMAGTRVWSSTPSVNQASATYLKTWVADYGDPNAGSGSDSGAVTFANANRETQAYAVHLIRGAQ